MGRGGDRKTTACEVHEGPSRWNQFDMLLTRYPLPQKNYTLNQKDNMTQSP